MNGVGVERGMRVTQGATFLCEPDPDEILRVVGGAATDINVLTFWSLEDAYPRGKLRYHLGQLGMTNLINELADKGCSVQTLICDASSRSVIGEHITPMLSDIEVTEAFIDRQRNPSVKVKRLSDLVDSLHQQRVDARSLSERAVRGALQFRNFIQQRRPPGAVLKSLSRFRAYFNLNIEELDEPTRSYLTLLQKEFPGVPEFELLASLFASHRRPKWFDAFWLGDVAAWVAIQAATNGTNTLILEANRSAYSWLTHTCFLRIGCMLEPAISPMHWPAMCFVNPLLSTTGEEAMQLDCPDEAIFLHHHPAGLRDRLEIAMPEALKSYRSWLLPKLPENTDSETIRKAVFDTVVLQTEKFDRDFMVRNKQATCKTRVPSSDNLRIGLCLSGGGFRATFYHLGIIRLLQQLDLLNRVTGVYAVSGGSILAGHLAKCWTSYSQPKADANSFMNASRPLFQMGQGDLRGRIVRRLLAFRWLTGTGWIPRFIENYYKRVGGLDIELRNLPTSPAFSFLATSMKTGKAVSFSRGGYHDGQHLFKCPDWPLARAVAASSAFPPVFSPIPIAQKDLSGSDGHDRGVEYLTDGGVYDNLGLSRLAADELERSDERWCSVVLVSDASAPFGSSLSDKFRLMTTRALRTTDILMKRVAELEAAANTSEYSSDDDRQRPYLVHAEIDTVVSPDNDFGLQIDHGRFKVQDEAVQKHLANIRTDLDEFSTLEIAALMRHGYEVALNSLTQAKLVPSNFVPEDPWRDMSLRVDDSSKAVSTLPSRTDEPKTEELRKKMEHASRRRLRLFKVSDWTSWLLVIYGIITASALAAQYYQFA